MSAWRGVVFRDYDAAGLDQFEVCVADGVVTMCDRLPDELTAYQSRAVAALLTAAADELERNG